MIDIITSINHDLTIIQPFLTLLSQVGYYSPQPPIIQPLLQRLTKIVDTINGLMVE